MSMNENVFLQSDASYDNKSRIAGIAVINMNNGEKYATTLTNIKSSMEAEFIALVFSVKIAMKMGYKHAVFVYDCLSLDLTNLKYYIQDKFETSQFLWLKREYINEADAEAKNALSIAKSLQKLNVSKKKLTEKKLKKLNRNKLIREFSSYSYKQIIQASMSIASKDEKELLSIFLKGNYDLCVIPKQEIRKVDLYKFIYQILPEKKEAFLAFISISNQSVLTNKFKERLPNTKLEEKINKIMNKLKNQKKAS